MSEHPEKIAEGRYLRLVKRGSWEYVERVNVADVAVLVPVTAANEIVLVEQYRIPVLATMIELPAGLVGDEDGFRGESLRDAANRELEEETGYRADCLTLLARSPTSGGLTSETVAFLHATGLARVGLGGGVAGEDIRVHVVRGLLDRPEDLCGSSIAEERRHRRSGRWLNLDVIRQATEEPFLY